jgi:hypothetical protein
MGISLEAMEFAGCYEARITGLASLGDHAALFAHVEEMIRSGQMCALLIDARGAELPQRQSVSREIWDDGLSFLCAIPLCYMPPPGESAERQSMIREVVAEWQADITFVHDRDAALDWCRRHARSPSV